MRSTAEVQRRLVFSLMRGAVRLAARFEMPLKAFEDLARLAYYEEVRKRGDASHQQAARLLQRSLRLIGMLEKQLRGDFFAPEDEVEYARKVEAQFSDTPQTVEAVAAAIGEEVADVQRVVGALALAGRVRKVEGGWVQDYTLHSLVDRDFSGRVDGLNHQLDAIAGVVSARFLSPQRPALARTLAFFMDPEEVEAVGEDCMRYLRERCGAAEESALRKGRRVSHALTIGMGPVEVT